MGYRRGSGVVALALATAATGMALTAGIDGDGGDGGWSRRGQAGADRALGSGTGGARRGRAIARRQRRGGQLAVLRVARQLRRRRVLQRDRLRHQRARRRVEQGAAHAETVPAMSSSVTSVSCPAAGDCLAGGGFSRDGAPELAFVVSETNGSWGAASALPGTADRERDQHGQRGLLRHPRRVRRRGQRGHGRGDEAIRERRAGRHLGRGPGSARPGRPEPRPNRGNRITVLCLAWQLRRRRVLCGPEPCHARVRRD